MEIPISTSVHSLSQMWHIFENQGKGFTLRYYLMIHRHISFIVLHFTALQRYCLVFFTN